MTDVDFDSMAKLIAEKGANILALTIRSDVYRIGYR